MREFDKLFGFKRITSFQTFDSKNVPCSQGVYAIMLPKEFDPIFEIHSCAGFFKGKDPTVTREQLESNWVENADVIYFGKATNLRQRLGQYLRFGKGVSVGHWGGRLIWQLANPQQLQIGWLETPHENPRSIEKSLIEGFRSHYGKAPFANEPHRMGK